MFVVSVVR